MTKILKIFGRIGVWFIGYYLKLACLRWAGNLVIGIRQ